MRHQVRSFASLIIATAFSASFPASTRAAEPVDIERIIVTSARGPEDVAATPRYGTVINAEDITSSNAQTIPEVLRTVAGVMIRDYTGTGKNVNVDMRGFGETGPSNILVLVDGRRVNAVDLSNTDWSQISLSQV